MSVEILAPGGSKEAILAGLYCGADAVYTGTSRFSARAFADNPTVEELCGLIDFAHLHGKKIYLTVNTLLTDDELEAGLYEMLLPLYCAGLDAVIVQDYGVLDFIADNFPGLDIHASTQMTLLTGDSANLLKPYGVTRIVPARELTIEEIKQMRQITDLELEVFVHGALCYCYSGQCLMSQVIGGRSGNRGMCAQPCRLPFTVDGEKTAYYLSTKDMCTVSHIPELIEAGVDSFKIEGRMKKPAYTAYTASVYRAYADAALSGLSIDDRELQDDIRKLSEIYNRGGFSSGYLFETAGTSMIYKKKNGHFGVCVGKITKADKGIAQYKLIRDTHYQDVLEFRNQKDEKVYEYTVKDGASANQEVSARYKNSVVRNRHFGSLPSQTSLRETGNSRSSFGGTVQPGQLVYRTKNSLLLDQIQSMILRKMSESKLVVCGDFTAVCGENISLTITYGDKKCSVSGFCAEMAKGKPVAAGEIEKRLRKTGESEFEFGMLNVFVDDNIFIPLGGIAALRREAFEKMREMILKDFKRSQKERAERECDLHTCELAFTLVQVTDFRQICGVKYVDKKKRERIRMVFRLESFDPGEWGRLVDEVGDIQYYVSLPSVLRTKNQNAFLKKWKQYGSKLIQGNLKGIVVDSLEAFPLIDKMNIKKDIELLAGSGLYLWNNRTTKMYKKFGLSGHITKIYGRTQIMITEGCVHRELGLCTKNSSKRCVHTICTPKKDEFMIENFCDCCYNVIYEKKASWHDLDRADDIPEICFTFEGEDEVRKVLNEWNF